MTATDTTETPSTGSLPQAEDAGQRMLDQLRADEAPQPILGARLHEFGCLLSALALHLTDEQWSTIAVLNPPADLGARLEVRCGTAETAAAVVAALPWENPPIPRREPGETSVHVVTRGVLWETRIAIVGLELAGGAS